jgi:hypothetical protein
METEQNVEYPRRWASQIDTNTFKVTTHYKHIEFVEQASTLKEADDKLCVAIAEAQKAEPKEYFGYTVKYWKVYGIVLAIGLVGLIIFCNTHAKNDEHTTITGQQDEATQVGSGGARVWWLNYIHVRGTRPDLPSGIHEVQPYQLGLNYAPQYYSNQIDREKFARSFEAELNRLIAENPDK